MVESPCQTYGHKKSADLHFPKQACDSLNIPMEESALCKHILLGILVCSLSLLD